MAGRDQHCGKPRLRGLFQIREDDERRNSGAGNSRVSFSGRAREETGLAGCNPHPELVLRTGLDTTVCTA